jgi:hypothetical protein
LLKDGEIFMKNSATSSPTLEDHRMAFTEISFLLDSFASTVDNIMGGSTASVGRIAGRGMAAKWPVDLDHATLQQTLAEVRHRMKNGFEISYAEQQNGVEVTFGKCVIREVCHGRALEQGGPLCKLFHSYFDGVVNGIVRRPVKSELCKTGDICSLCLKVQ